MSNAPLVTNAKQTAPTNMVVYLRNRRSERACGGVPPVPAPGWPANDVIRSIPRPGRERRAPILRCLTIACWAAPAPGENFIRLGFARCRRTRQSAADAFPRRDLYDYRHGAMSSHDLNCALSRKSLSIWRSPGGNGWQLMFDDANL